MQTRWKYGNEVSRLVCKKCSTHIIEIFHLYKKCMVCVKNLFSMCKKIVPLVYKNCSTCI